MLNVAPQFAQASDSASGIGAFNINLKSFVFQLITFVIVLLVFKRWVLPPLLKTLEDRRQTLERSLTQAESRRASERTKLHQELKAELADLVANATETILRQKLDEKTDRKLIEQSLREIA